MTAAMPIRMPSIVNADRIRRVRIASSAVRLVSVQFIEPATSSDARRGEGRLFDQAVPDPDDPAGPAGDVGLVGDQHDGAPRVVQLAEKLEYVCGGTGVEVARRFVGEDQRR